MRLQRPSPHAFGDTAGRTRFLRGWRIDTGLCVRPCHPRRPRARARTLQSPTASPTPSHTNARRVACCCAHPPPCEASTRHARRREAHACAVARRGAAHRIARDSHPCCPRGSRRGAASLGFPLQEALGARAHAAACHAAARAAAGPLSRAERGQSPPLAAPCVAGRAWQGRTTWGGREQHISTPRAAQLRAASIPAAGRAPAGPRPAPLRSIARSQARTMAAVRGQAARYTLPRIHALFGQG